MGETSKTRKFFAEARRRGWLIAVVIVVAVIAAWGIGRSTSSATAEAVLVAKAKGPLTEQPNSSAKLAATYAALITLDPKVEEAIEPSLPAGESWSLAASNDPNTAILHLTVTAKESSAAIAGARAGAKAISGPAPVSSGITPSTVAIARLPQKASKQGIALGIVLAVFLGGILGVVLLVFWRAADPRIDTIAELAVAAPWHAREVDLDTKVGYDSLIEILPRMNCRTFTVLPCRRRDWSCAQAIAGALRSAFGRESLSLGRVPGSADAGELDAAASDCAVLVMSRGIKARDVDAAQDTLERVGVHHVLAVLARGTLPESAGSTGDAGATAGVQSSA